MKKRYLILPATLGPLFAVAVYFSTVYSQTSATKTVSAAPSAVKPNFARFAKAAEENSRLRSTLRWTFGGKMQTGWDIYVPLVSHAIGSEAAAESPEFADALSKWQVKNGLTASGVLDRETLEGFVKFWQSQRRGRSGSVGNLTSAPIAEFYDSTRSPDLLQLETETHAAYRKMIAAAAAELKNELKLTKTGELAPEEKFLRIISAYRSPAYQAALRKKEPNAGRAALAVNSPHSTGYALDIYVGGEPVITKDANRLIQVKTPAYRWLVKNAHRFGFYPYFYEPWHWEYVPGQNRRM